MPYFTFTKLAREMANQGWGIDVPDMNSAIRKVDASKAALLELVRRFDQICRALAPKEKRNLYKVKAIARPDNIKLFPNAKIGDRFYIGDTESGFECFLVIRVEQDGAALVISTQSDSTSDHPRYATESYFTSLAEAVADDAKGDLIYFGKRLVLAKRALAAVEAGDDLSEFEKGVDLENEANPDVPTPPK